MKIYIDVGVCVILSDALSDSGSLIQICVSILGAALVVKLSGTCHLCEELAPCADEFTSRKCFCEA